MKEIPLDKLWDQFELNINESAIISLGALKLVIRHEAKEWSLAYDWFEQDDDIASYVFGSANDFSEIQSNTHRYAYSLDSNLLRLSAKLADRSIVTRPRVPFYLLAKQKTWLYVSSPIWIEVIIGTDTVLKEIPVFRPSDTWFGINTTEGEIAYSTRTHARQSLDETSDKQYRAITPVELINNTNDSIYLERISLPVPMLHLFSDYKNNLWTSPLTIVREANNGTSIKIESTPPAQADDIKQLSSPRQETERNVFTKTIHALFG